MKAVLIGSTGQLGTDIVGVWPGDGRMIALTHSDIEVADRSQVFAVLSRHAPDLVVNTAAFHNVDRCEEEADHAFAVNAVGAMNVADACQELGAVLLHVSTDYVFSGGARQPYTESDLPDPVNVYGVSKAAGEQLIRTRHPEHYIVRTSGLYGVAGASGKGGNFVERMLQLARDGKDIHVVDDQVFSPTFTADLAECLFDVAQSGRFGTYHITNGNWCSWYEFAVAIFEMTHTEANLYRTTTSAFGAKAQRPAFSVLANEALSEAGMNSPRPWPQALAEYLRRKNYLTGGVCSDHYEHARIA